MGVVLDREELVLVGQEQGWFLQQAVGYKLKFQV